ncbi:PREDICTED: uncharacterized protein LOC109211391 [Nicotiana attenuata]|uniref:uncharacterized protein LOC109211391 n=1 Tax=Nicotiana attenuata TaxID=49451 RepID=UPI000904CB6D|nr:PREDICTED: uncharacterized protein LOC109211391 [Nicotiana attenuata]
MSNANDNNQQNQQHQLNQQNQQGDKTPAPSPRNSPRQSREGSPDRSESHANDQHGDDQAIDEALIQLIAEQVNNSLQAFVSGLPTKPPTPPPDNTATIENPHSGLANSGSGGTPSEYRNGRSVEICEPITRYNQATEESNEEEMRINLGLLEERRETALIRMAAQKQIVERYYNQKAHLRYFKIEDFVLKKVFLSTKAAKAEKLSPNWEGPYKIRGIAGKGAYKLETMDGKVLPSSWNAVHLKKYYF